MKKAPIKAVSCGASVQPLAKRSSIAAILIIKLFITLKGISTGNKYKENSSIIHVNMRNSNPGKSLRLMTNKCNSVSISSKAKPLTDLMLCISKEL